MFTNNAISADEVTRLNNQRKRVTESQARFHAYFAIGAISQAPNRPLTIQELTSQVQNDMQAWASKRESGYGKARTRIQNFLSVMNDHSYLFSVIPNGDKYTSLVTGVISSVVKVCASRRFVSFVRRRRLIPPRHLFNHKKIAERFSSYLAEIGEDLRSVQKSVQIANTPDMRRFVVKLYDKMFDFLATAMEWYQSRTRRFRSALNQNYDETLSSKVDAIRSVLGRIRQEAEHITQARIHEADIRRNWLYAKIAAKDMRDSANAAHLQGKLDELSAQFASLTVGQEMKGTLQAVGQHTIHGIWHYLSVSSCPCAH